MRTKLKKAMQLIAIIIIGVFMVATVVSFAHNSADRVLARGPISPPEGYPKLSLSTKVVTPTLANTDGAVLTYSLVILNTGAYTAEQVTLTDTIPLSTTFNNDAQSSSQPDPVFANGVLSWHGEVGFDASVEITFSVTVTPGFEGIASNTAVISDPQIAEPVTVTAETRVTDSPSFEISKSATPALPGRNKPLTYELVVTNVGQPAEDAQIVVNDFIPTYTTFINASPGFTYDPIGNAVTWEPTVTLGTNETTAFTFSVNIDSVAVSGTIIENNSYQVASLEGFSPGVPHTTTVIDPILILSKSIYPDPPGANREMTYTLTVLNLGSLATNVTITDTVPANVDYVRGGTPSQDESIVSWVIPSLDTRESAQVTYTVKIGDIAGPDYLIENHEYIVCSDEGVCADGLPVTSLIVGPTFEVTASLYPIAHKPGGGPGNEEEVTPTLTIKNLGPGNAIDANALLTFGNISVSNEGVFEVLPPGNGAVAEGPLCTVSNHCLHYVWTGDINVGEMITITTIEPQSTIGGEEWNPYTATVVVTDVLGTYVTEPITATAIGHVTHMSNLIPTKSAPLEIGPGQTMTYTIKVVDSGLSTEATPFLTETVPSSVTLVEDSISDGGSWETVNGRTAISWTLPDMGPGDFLFRSFAVTTDPDLVSGTLIVNDDYQTSVYESWIKDIKTVVGEPVTTTIHEVGLIDSYKTVTPTWALPGDGTVLTWTVHVVNSGPNDLSGVQVTDIFPWQDTTYQRDAVATSGTTSLISDIVSLEWTGNVEAFSEELITFTTVVDEFFEGVITNTATITHESLMQPVEVSAVAYITDKPVLRISKTATPDPVSGGGTLLYQIEVTNLGQQATMLTITDTIPANTTYVEYSASSGGQVMDNVLQWIFPVLNHGDTLHLSFQVVVFRGDQVVNDLYAVRCEEGVFAYGDPVITRVVYAIKNIFMPVIQKH